MNMERVRQQNRSLILNFINDQGPSSRKDLAIATGLTPASVTYITTALIEEGILYEVGAASDSVGNVGRRKILLDIDAKSSLAFVVNAEPDKTTIAICDLMGQLVCGKDEAPLLHQLSTDNKKAPEEFLEEIAEICKELKSKLSRQLKERVEHLSFTTTGIVDRENGISKHAYGIWNQEVPVRKILKNILRVPVLLENNVDAFAAAELLYGSGKTYKDFLVIKWGPGVGSSVVIDGQVYHGRGGKTAEMGHVIMDPGGAKCICGRTGCLETKVSEAALARLQTTEEKKEVIDLFARSIVNTGTILAPEDIVLFGSISKDSLLRERLIEACMKYDPSYNADRIVHTELSEKESYIGPAAVYTRQKFFQ